MEPPPVTPALLDHSAWSRIAQLSLPVDVRHRVRESVLSRSLVTCLPFLLEAGYSARSGNDHAALAHELAELPRVVIDADAEQRVLVAQAQLAVTGHHRLPPADLIIAALADLHGLAVLHYDADYDVILQHTDLRYESRWLAPRGSL